MKVSLPVAASWITARKPPPMPEASGCTTDSEVPTAIAASTALPPRARTSKPASVASALALAIAAVFAAAVSCAWASTPKLPITSASSAPCQYGLPCAGGRQVVTASPCGVFRSVIGSPSTMGFEHSHRQPRAANEKTMAWHSWRLWRVASCDARHWRRPRPTKPPLRNGAFVVAAQALTSGIAPCRTRTRPGSRTANWTNTGRRHSGRHPPEPSSGRC